MSEETKERFGDYLRKQREIRGFSLEEISEQTKISLSALRALEAEDWEILPAEIYVRGFIRCYCQTIGLDPNEALLRFEEAYQPYKRQKQEKYHRDEEYLAKKSSPLKWIILSLILLLVLALGYFFFYQRAHRANPSLPKTESGLEVTPETSTLPAHVKEEAPGFGVEKEQNLTPSPGPEVQERP